MAAAALAAGRFLADTALGTVVAAGGAAGAAALAAAPAAAVLALARPSTGAGVTSSTSAVLRVHGSVRVGSAHAGSARVGS